MSGTASELQGYGVPLTGHVLAVVFCNVVVYYFSNMADAAVNGANL